MMSLRTIREDKRNDELLQPLDWSSDIPLHLHSVKIPIGQLVTLPDEKKKQSGCQVNVGIRLSRYH
jgi:hypothetical protein